MVTATKKPKAAAKPRAAAKPKAATKPKAAAKPKTDAKPKAAAKPKAVAKPKAAAKPEAAAKPKAVKPATAVKAKTVNSIKAEAARKVGEMIYNDELLESLAEVILSGYPATATMLPEIKNQMFDYDIYMVSFLEKGELADAAKKIADGGKISEDELLPALTDIRDNARIFVDIASKHNSVRAFIDQVIEAEGRSAGIDKLKISFEGIKPDPACCESILLLF